MSFVRISSACLLLLLCFSRLAAAQAPVLRAASTTIPPGQSVAVQLVGAPFAHFAVIGSVTNAGFSFAGVALAVGTDVVVLATGVLDATGVATIAGDAAVSRHDTGSLLPPGRHRALAVVRGAGALGRTGASECGPDLRAGWT